MQLSQLTRNILENAGWSPLRKIDIKSYEEALLADGYQINDSVRNFLSEFGGLEINHPAYRVQGEEDKSHFDPIRAIGGIYHETVEEYEKRVGENLVVIGEGYNGHLVFLISESGKVFGAYDDYLTLLGNNIIEALEAICERKETAEIH